MKIDFKTRLLVVYLVLLFILTGVLYLQKTDRDIPNLNNYSFENYKIGNLSFEKPKTFKFKKNELQSNNQAVLSDKTFQYEQKNLFLNIASIKYADGVDFDTKSVYKQRKNYYSKADNISDVVILNEKLDINERPGIKYKIFFKPDNKGGLVQNGIVLKNQQTLFLVEFIYKQQASNAEELSDKIINSLRFTK